MFGPACVFALWYHGVYWILISTNQSNYLSAALEWGILRDHAVVAAFIIYTSAMQQEPLIAAQTRFEKMSMCCRKVRGKSFPKAHYEVRLLTCPLDLSSWFWTHLYQIIFTDKEKKHSITLGDL